ncbi:MAG TPA: DUF4884 domain-containing protein [Gemmatimonadaceae bacterium]|nr:DUF4884 domain-containing protein [Gemmatimonadaceae bacterium]
MRFDRQRAHLYDAGMRAIILLLAIAVSGCLATPVSSSPTNNQDIDVQQLFTHEGCTVYRFRDGGYHYYVRCAQGVAQTMSPQSCGKNCVRDEAISTTP